MIAFVLRASSTRRKQNRDLTNRFRSLRATTAQQDGLALVLKCDVHNEERPRRGRRAEVAILSTPDRVGVKGSGADKLSLISPLVSPLSNAIKGYSPPGLPENDIHSPLVDGSPSEAVSKSASRSAQASQRDGTGLGNVLRSPFRRSWRSGPGAGSSFLKSVYAPQQSRRRGNQLREGRFGLVQLG